MPLKITLLLYLTLLPYISLGQKTLVGQVVDPSTLDPLPFVNIGLVNKNIGTVTDEEGYFQLEVDPKKYGKSNLRFSMIGYESKTFQLEEYLQNELIIIPLAEEATALEEVVVTTKRTNFQTKLLGNKTNSKFIYASFTTNKLGNEMGFVVRQRKPHHCNGNHLRYCE
jgi:hypothetical protein